MGVRSGNEDIINGRLDNVAEAIGIQEAAAKVGPDARGFEGELSAGVEDAARNLAGGRAGARRIAVVSVAAAHARDEIEPAEESLRQSDLMVSIDAAGFVVVGGDEAVSFGEEMAIIAGGTFALVIKRGVPQLLAVAGEAQIREALDGVQPIVDARLDVEIEAEIFPDFFGFDERAGLGVFTVFPFKEVVDDAEVALVADLRADAEVVERFAEIGEV